MATTVILYSVSIILLLTTIVSTTFHEWLNAYQIREIASSWSFHTWGDDATWDTVVRLKTSAT
jgi:hypothetical protein